jgi:succinate dehydrogenase / fumarate reductase cytochrome b subunit
MVVGGFQQPSIVLLYVLGVGAVCLHISHGIGSMVQTLGLNTARTIPVFTWTGRILAAVIFLGYCAIPLAVISGYVK